MAGLPGANPCGKNGSMVRHPRRNRTKRWSGRPSRTADHASHSRKQYSGSWVNQERSDDRSTSPNAQRAISAGIGLAATDVKRPAPKGAVRIIAGRWRRRLLPVAVTGRIRPTPDRVRETLFNWLNGDVDGARCLDLFAGTGALGFEAASRGAKAVVMVERERGAAGALEGAVRALGADNVEVICADALAWTPSTGERFGIVFLDPPYSGPAPEACLARLDHLDALAAHCLVYLETNRDPACIGLPPGWRFLHARRAGRVRYHLVSRSRPAGRRWPAQGGD